MTPKAEWLPYLTLAVAAFGSLALVVVALLQRSTQKLVKANTKTTEETAAKTVEIAVNVDGRVTQLLDKSDAVIRAHEAMIVVLTDAITKAYAAGGVEARDAATLEADAARVKADQAQALTQARAEGVREGAAITKEPAS